MDITPTVIISTLIGFAFFGVQVAIATVAISQWTQTREQMRPSAILTLIIVLLSLPASVVSLVYLDPSAANPDVPAGMRSILQWVVRFAIVGGTGLNVFLLLMQVPVAMRLGGPHPLPVLYRQTDAGRGLPLAAGLGALLGGISVALFYALEVDPGELIEMAKKMIPGVDMETPAYVIGVSLPAVIGMAISEELLFRGIMQRWLAGKLSGKVGGTWIAICATSTIWAMAHLANVEQVGLKLTQIFLLGLLFGYLTKRYSVEASMAAHVGLNIVAVVAPLGMRMAGLT